MWLVEPLCTEVNDWNGFCLGGDQAMKIPDQTYRLVRRLIATVCFVHAQCCTYPYVFWARTPIDDQMVRWSDGQMYGQMVRYLK